MQQSKKKKKKKLASLDCNTANLISNEVISNEEKIDLHTSLKKNTKAIKTLQTQCSNLETKCDRIVDLLEALVADNARNQPKNIKPDPLFMLPPLPKTTVEDLTLFDQALLRSSYMEQVVSIFFFIIFTVKYAYNSI